jgi:hypothetical protein
MARFKNPILRAGTFHEKGQCFAFQMRLGRIYRTMHFELTLVKRRFGAYISINMQI